MDLKKELYDVYDMCHTPFWQTRLFFFSLLVLGLCLVFVCVWYVIRARKEKKYTRTAWQQALDELQELQKSTGLSVEQGKMFYHELTALLKRYLQNRFGFQVADKTDDELIDYLRSVDFSTQLLEQVRAILQGSLYVKFANAQAVKEQIGRDIDASRAFIEKTIPPENDKKD